MPFRKSHRRRARNNASSNKTERRICCCSAGAASRLGQSGRTRWTTSEREGTDASDAEITRKKKGGKQLSRYGGIASPTVLAAARELITLRSQLFMTPSAYFDPFASPLLFLRAPGRDTPTTLGTVAGDAFMNDLDFEDEGYGSTGSHHDHSHQNRLSPAPTTSSGAGFSEQSFQGSEDERPRSPSQPERPPRRRKVLQRWPPNGRPDDVMLPYVNIFLRSPSPSKADAGHAAIMQAQGNELCELMRRACFIGREESLAIEHVQQETFSHLDPERDTTVADRDNATSMRPRAIEWINEMFHGKDDDNDHELSRSTRSLSETQLHH